VGAAIVDGDALGLQLLFDSFLQLEASMVGSQSDFHGKPL